MDGMWSLPSESSKDLQEQKGTKPEETKVRSITEEECMK